MEKLEFRDMDQPNAYGKILGMEKNMPGPNRVKVNYDKNTPERKSVKLKYILKIYENMKIYENRSI